MRINSVKNDYNQDNATFAEEMWEMKRLGATQAKNLADSTEDGNSPDLEEFVLRYQIAFSDFA